MISCYECLTSVFYFILFYECFFFFDKSYCSSNIMGKYLEDSATHPFVPEKWIGKGRKLPSPNDIPQGLAEIQRNIEMDYEGNRYI